MKKENGLISVINDLTLLLAAMVVTMSVPVNWSLLALLAMVIILPVAFTIVIASHIEKWPLKVIVTRAIALGVVLMIASSFAMVRGILEYQSTSVIPLWIHIMAITYILAYWDSFYATRAVAACRIVYLERRICVMKVRKALMSNWSRVIRVGFGDLLDYEQEYLDTHTRIAKKGKKERTLALVNEVEFAGWLAKKFDFDADAAIQFVADREAERPQSEPGQVAGPEDI